MNTHSKSTDDVLKRVDHLVYATTDLERSICELEKILGVRPEQGGRHPGRGTRNALVALSDWSYLEIIGPDPDQPQPKKPRWLGIDDPGNPRLFTWAVKEADLDGLSEKAVRGGVRLGQISAGSRQRSDGVTLSWRFTDPGVTVADGLVPFFINWQDSPHPAMSAPRGATLVSLKGQHPQPAQVERMLSAVGIKLPVEYGAQPMLIATLNTANGPIDLK